MNYSSSPSPFPLAIAARESPLSQAQVQELLGELREFYPGASFAPRYLASTGDRDLKRSLRDLDKTDFFTREIDELQLSGQVRVGVHSAKDLADPLPEGLAIVALTRGVDPADALVLREGASFEKLPHGAFIATSSHQREATVRSLRSDLRFVDIRGTIHQRLARVESEEVDGVVVAEAALIRLGLTHLNRLRLPGRTAEHQGQLAVVALAQDHEMHELFACLDVRKTPALLRT